MGFDMVSALRAAIRHELPEHVGRLRAEGQAWRQRYEITSMRWEDAMSALQRMAETVSSLAEEVRDLEGQVVLAQENEQFAVDDAAADANMLDRVYSIMERQGDRPAAALNQIKYLLTEGPQE